MEDILLVKIKEDFRQKIFSLIKSKYNTWKKSYDFYGIKKSNFDYYRKKNSSIPLNILNIICKDINVKNCQIQKGIQNIFSKREQIQKIIKMGQEKNIRTKKEKYNSNISLKKFVGIKNEKLILNCEMWLNQTKWVKKLKESSGLISNVSKHQNDKNILIEFKNLNRKKFTEIPKKIMIEENFCYFLGLLYGDGLSGARLGLSNKNVELINWVSDFLKKTFSTSRTQLIIYLYKKQDINIYKEKLTDSIDYIKTYLYLREGKQDYVYDVFIINNIFKRIIENLFKHFLEFFNMLTYSQKGALLAGLFDAEGNINKRDNNLRISQKIKDKVQIIKEMLKTEGYNARYDQVNFIIGYKKQFREKDFILFKKQILPFIKHPQKIKESKELLSGNRMIKSDILILKKIHENPNITSKELSTKYFENKRLNFSLKALFDQNLVRRKRKQVSESFKYRSTVKGLKLIKGD